MGSAARKTDDREGPRPQEWDGGWGTAMKHSVMFYRNNVPWKEIVFEMTVKDFNEQLPYLDQQFQAINEGLA